MIKKNKIVLLSAWLFTSYLMYIMGSYLYFLIKKDIYGNVYNNILIYPHFIFILIGVIANFIAYYKCNKIFGYISIICYLIAIFLLFI